MQKNQKVLALGVLPLLGAAALMIPNWADSSSGQEAESPAELGRFETFGSYQELSDGMGLETDVCISPVLAGGTPSASEPMVVVHVEHTLFDAARKQRAHLHLHRVVGWETEAQIESSMSIPVSSGAEESVMEFHTLTGPQAGQTWAEVRELVPTVTNAWVSQVKVDARK